ncbi:MAG: hypothetical protein ACLUUJ_03330 [Acutalibacteraceae bacterium]
MNEILFVMATGAATGALLVLIGNQIVALWRLRRQAAEEARMEQLDKIAAHNRAVIIRDLIRGKL